MKPVNKKTLACQLGKIRDNKAFRRSTRKGSAVYEVDRKIGVFVIFTSRKSERTFKAFKTLMVYPV